jgi:putative oxidoreductase
MNKIVTLDCATAWGVVERVRGLLESIPYSVIALFARAATFTVFWRSGMQKLADWNSTLMLFTNEYRVPILPPHVAAYIAVSLELGGSVLVLMGLMTRPSVFLLLGMVSVIQIFVYPQAWPDHIQWFAFMFLLLARGPGRVSLDDLICRVARHSPKEAQERLGAAL